MTTEHDLLAAIRADPYDDHARLVYADWLLARDDPRGELLVLEHRDRTTPSGLRNREALARLVELAAIHGFLWIPDEPALPRLSFEGGGSHPVQYEVDHGGHHYYLRYRHGELSGVLDEQWDRDDFFGVELLGFADDGDWTGDETGAILGIIGEAIQLGRSFDTIRWPNGETAAAHGRFGVMRDHERWCVLWDRLQRWEP
jgi:uncharacterized protein (TIGR02996 family)